MAKSNFEKVEAVVGWVRDKKITGYRISKETNAREMSIIALAQGRAKVKNISFETVLPFSWTNCQPSESASSANTVFVASKAKKKTARATCNIFFKKFIRSSSITDCSKDLTVCQYIETSQKKQLHNCNCFSILAWCNRHHARF